MSQSGQSIFSLLPGEEVLKDSTGAGVKTGLSVVADGNLYLTNRRLVCCKKGLAKTLVYGPLYSFTTGTKIVAEIPLNSVRNIKLGTYGLLLFGGEPNKLIIETKYAKTIEIVVGNALTWKKSIERAIIEQILFTLPKPRLEETVMMVLHWREKGYANSAGHDIVAALKLQLKTSSAEDLAQQIHRYMDANPSEKEAIQNYIKTAMDQVKELKSPSYGTRSILGGYVCPSCGENNKEENTVCQKCGYDLVKKCLSCKRGIPLNTIHCPFCGESEKTREIEKLKVQIDIEETKLITSQSGLLGAAGLTLLLALLGLVSGGFGQGAGGVLLSLFLGVIALVCFVRYRNHLNQRRMIEKEIENLEKQIYILKKKDKQDRRSNPMFDATLNDMEDSLGYAPSPEPGWVSGKGGKVRQSLLHRKHDLEREWVGENKRVLVILLTVLAAFTVIIAMSFLGPKKQSDISPGNSGKDLPGGVTPPLQRTEGYVDCKERCADTHLPLHELEYLDCEYRCRNKR